MKTEQTATVAKPKSHKKRYPSVWRINVLAALKAHPAGLTVHQIGVLLELSPHSVNKALTDLRSYKKCVYGRRSKTCAIWWHVDYVAALIQQKHEQFLLSRARSAVWRKEGKYAPKDQGDFERPSLQLLVSASTAVRLRPAGPASVWDLAA